MSPFLDEYEPVENRLRAFHEDHPYGRIITELLPERNAGEYIVLASVFLGSELRNDPPAATGLASEFTGTSNVNKTSALENCETSAIGRALANLGYAPKGKRPSREEMSKASRPSGATSAASAAQAASPSSPQRTGRGEIQPSQVTLPPPSDSATGPIRSRPLEGSTTDVEHPVTDAVAADPKRSGEVAEDAAATATSEQWERLLTVAGGSASKALSRLNKANRSSYTKSTQEYATKEEVALAITGGAE